MTATTPVLHSTPHWASAVPSQWRLLGKAHRFCQSRQELCWGAELRDTVLPAPSSSDSLTENSKKSTHAAQPGGGHNQAVPADTGGCPGFTDNGIPITITESTAHMKRLTLGTRAAEKLPVAAGTPGRTQPSQSSRVMGLQVYARAGASPCPSALWKTPARVPLTG